MWDLGDVNIYQNPIVDILVPLNMNRKIGNGASLITPSVAVWERLLLLLSFSPEHLDFQKAG